MPAASIVDPGRGTTEETNVLCLATGEGGLCGDTQSLLGGHLTAFDGDHIYGLVPDGVAQVVLRYPDGETLSTSVQDNLFWIDGPPMTTRG